METYPRGRRGAPAKGLGRIKPAREFKSLCLRFFTLNVNSMFFLTFFKSIILHYKNLLNIYPNFYLKFKSLLIIFIKRVLYYFVFL